MAAVALLLPEATKLTLGRDFAIYTPRNVSNLLLSKGGFWLSASHLLRYQALLLKGPTFQLKIIPILNPTTFLPEEGEDIRHGCEQIILQTYAGSEGLRETPLENLDLILYADGWKLLCGARGLQSRLCGCNL